MRWLILVLFLAAFTPVISRHDTPEKVDIEIANIEANLQAKEFSIFKDTPSLGDLRDGEMVFLSSGTLNKILWRVNQEIYAVQGSCITIRR